MSPDRRTKGLSLGLSALLVVALIPAFTVLDAATTTDAASAVPVPPAQNVQAQMADHTGWNGNSAANPQSGDCVRYGIAANAVTTGVAPNTGGANGTSGANYTNGSTAFVSSGTTAYSGHGNNSCQAVPPGGVNLGTQSALGFAPASVASFEPAGVFNLGRFVHRNNPVNVSNSWFRGDMNIQFMGMNLTYQWRLNETTNNASPPSNPANNDVLDFLNQVSNQSFLGADGNRYTLVVLGFTAPQNGTTCDATLPNIGTILNNFSTVEQATTYGCLYASVQQIRTLTVTKVVEAPFGNPPSIPSFPFTSVSDVAGSVWGTSFALQPTAAGPAGSVSRTQDFVLGQTVTITETDPVAPWAFVSLSCVDGLGAPMNITSNRTITLSGNIAVVDPAAAAIRCTYTNRYTPRATLTLRKTVVTTGQPAPIASPFNWTLSAAGTGLVSGNSISGRGQTGQTVTTANPAITNQSVIAGTYTLGEVPDGTRTGGYVQDGPWSCVLTGTSTPVTVTSSQVTLANGQNVTCTVTNRFQTGTLAITKTVTSSPAGGYAQGTALAFTAQYSCVSGSADPIVGTVTVRPNAVNGQAGTAATIPNLPAGASCTVTELNPPSGSAGLVNTSWMWGSPLVGPPQTVTIPVGATATVGITNPVTQQTGQLRITKAITARDGTPAVGYTGGSGRTFSVGYSCSIGAVVVASGQATISTGTAAVIPGVPATALCSITSETLTAQAGDFADASYHWDGFVASPTTVTVPVSGVATLGVTNFFERELVALTIAKVVEGAGYTGTGANFTVGYSCGQVSGSVTIAAGGSDTVQVPANVQCSVVENPPSAALLAPGYVWGGPSYAGLTAGTIAIPVGGTGTVTVTNPNSIGFGRIQVSKAIANFADQVAPGTAFSVAVECDAPPADGGGDFSETYVLTWPGDIQRTTPYLPIGTTCTVTETAAPSGSDSLSGPSYAWVGIPPAQEVTVPQSTTPAAVVVTNDIERVFGLLRIEKVVVNNTAATITQPFTGTWECTLTQVRATGTWTAPASGGLATLQPGGTTSTPQLVGSVCSVTETTPPIPVPGDESYSWTVSQPAPVTVVAAGATATVTNTLNRATGSFNVSKSVVGGEAGTAFVDEPFTFTYSCESLSGEIFEGELSVPVNGSTAPPEDVPGLSTCIVTESPEPAAIDPFTWDGVTLTVTGAQSSEPQDGRSIQFRTPANGATVSVAAVDTISRKTVSVTVDKVVTDPDDGFTGGSAEMFPVVLTCDLTSYPVQNIAAGGSQVWTDIPLGSTCSATELAITGGLADASFAWGQPAYSPESVQLDDPDGTYSITVTNTITRVRGEIAVVKIFDDGGFPGVVDPDRSYSGDWSCTYGDEDAVTGTWAGTGSAAGAPAELTGPWDQILLTSTCEAAEDSLGTPSATDPSFVWETPVLTPIDVGPDAAANTMTVTNTIGRETGSVTVEKTLSGETQGFAPEAGFAGFPVGIECTTPGGGGGSMPGSVDVVAGAAPVPLLADVPLGWSCTVNEASVTGQLLDDSYRWAGTTIEVDGEAVTTFTVDGAHAVVVDNAIERVLGTLSITKVIDAAVPAGVVPADLEFTGSYSCSYPGTPAAVYEGEWAVTGAGAATLTGDTEIPLTSTCSAEEDALDDADLDGSWRWGAAVISAPATVTSETSPAELTVTNTTERLWSGLEIVKEYTGVAGALPPGTNVTGTWSCTYAGQPIAGGSGQWTVPAAGGSTTVVTVGDALLPATSQCTILENTLSEIPLTDASYVWNSPTYSPAGGVVTLEPEAVGTVTVTNSTQRVFTSFDVTKTLVEGTNVPDDGLDPSLLFSGTYSCVYGTDAPVTGTWGPIAAGGRWSSPAQILVGSTCTVTGEDPPADPVGGDPSFVWLPVDLGTPVTALPPTATAATVNVTNEAIRILAAGFSVTKVVDGDLTGLVDGSVFDFEWSCEADNGDQYPADGPGSFSLIDGGLWSVPESVPVSAECTVTEVGMPDPAHPSYTWSAEMGVTGAEGTPSGSSIVFELPADTADPVLVTATNTLTRTVGTYSVAKSSDPPTGSTVEPGQTITYTVTITPGPVGFVDDVVVVDDLAAVTPFATLDESTIVASQGTAGVEGGSLVWSAGRVDAEEGPLTLGYTVTVDAGAWGVTIRNAVTATGEVPPDEGCDPCTTSHLTPKWELTKSSDPASGSTVLPGEQITYTLTATNVADAPVIGASVTDDLSAVLDDAELAEPLEPGLTLSGTSLLWAIPDLESGESATVSYTVTVAEGAWGASLVNVATPDQPSGECVEPGTPAEDAAVALLASLCSTAHEVPAWTLEKSSDPASGFMVGPGSVITYTLTATNTSDAVVSGATAVDDLTGVLVHASLLLPLPSSVSQSGTTLTWSIPDLGPGESVSVSYAIQVHADAPQTTIRNVVVAVGSGGECGVCDTSHLVVPGLPPTGAYLPIGLLLAGALLVLGGLGLWMIRRRREHEPAA